MRILVVEDNPDILANIIDYLSLKGYTVDSARDGLTGLHKAVNEPFDLLILDIMLPALDGLSLCQRLRGEAASHVPVIMLTARDTLDDRLLGFRSGADDYLIKPFSLAELDARVQAVLRRSQGEHQRRLQVADLSHDLDTLETHRQGRRLQLGPAGRRLLELLMRRSPTVVRREDLEEALWGDQVPDNDNLRAHMHQLRNIIDKPFDQPLLETVHGTGYRLRAHTNEE